MIRNYCSSDEPALLALWNTSGTQMGFVPVSPEQFRKILINHPDFRAEYTFILEIDGKIRGFVNGCTGSHIPRGDVRGYLTCLILDEEANTAENTAALLDSLEQAFRNAWKAQAAVTFFNPIHIPWIIPGTDGHQHNNAPGIALDLPLHKYMIHHGYQETTQEQAMYMDLNRFSMPDAITEKALEMEKSGYRVVLYEPDKYDHLEEMLRSLGNPLWIEEITAAARNHLDFLVGLSGNTIAGFAGPIYPEETGRGYFTGIGVSPEYEHHGLGKLMFYRLCLQEKKCGAQYMSLFTGKTNPAGKIYLEAGFRVVRTFGVMIKEL